MIKKEEILKGYEVEYPLTSFMKSNLAVLLTRLNKLRDAWGKPMVITSGYRPQWLNEKVGGAKNSCHLVCKAADIADPKGELYKWLTVERLALYDLYMEEGTSGWIHLDIKPRKHRIFLK